MHRAAAPFLALVLSAAALAADYVPVIPVAERVAEGIRYEDLFQVVRADGTVQELVRCGAPRPEPGIVFEGEARAEGGSAADCDGSTNPDPLYDPFPGGSYLVDVWVHVLKNAGGDGEVPVEEIFEQLAVLNEDFRGIPLSNGDPGADSRLFFRYLGHDVTTNTTWFNDSGAYYDTLAVTPGSVLNIYTNSAGGALGYVPTLPHSASPGFLGSDADRVVILWESFGRDRGLLPEYDLGRTTTHEVGHFFGLAHTFDSVCRASASPQCLSNSDMICDTPPERQPNFEVCPPDVRDSCTQYAGNDPIENYMDYSYDACMDRFTNEQKRRIRCTIEHYRSGLLQPILFYDDFETADTQAWDVPAGL
jgi:hypothetical protein